MKQLGIEGVRRGRRCMTTIPSEAADKPPDLVNREFSADLPNPLWVADTTDCATLSGFVSVLSLRKYLFPGFDVFQFIGKFFFGNLSIVCNLGSKPIAI